MAPTPMLGATFITWPRTLVWSSTAARLDEYEMVSLSRKASFTKEVARAAGDPTGVQFAALLKLNEARPIAADGAPIRRIERSSDVDSRNRKENPTFDEP